MNKSGVAKRIVGTGVSDKLTMHYPVDDVDYYRRQIILNAKAIKGKGFAKTKKKGR